MSTVLANSNPVTLLGAGDAREGTLARALGLAPALYALDGGADTALALGHRPLAVLGDLDSLSDTARATLPLIETPDQDYPDFDKALSLIEAPLVLALGVTGSRFDHALAGLTALLRHPHRRVIVFAGGDIACLVPPALAFEAPRDLRVSLYPMRAMRCGSTGLTWGTDGLVLDPFARIGTSNAARGGRVTLAPDMPAMLLILPAEALGALAPALSAAAPWPAPARAR